MDHVKAGTVLQIEEVKESTEECSCDYDIDCAYCLGVYENEKGLIEEVHWTAEDDAADIKTALANSLETMAAEMAKMKDFQNRLG